MCEHLGNSADEIWLEVGNGIKNKDGLETYGFFGVACKARLIRRYTMNTTEISCTNCRIGDKFVVIGDKFDTQKKFMEYLPVFASHEFSMQL